MTWTMPATATTGQVITAAFWNAQIPNNMLETAAATATTAGDLVYADAANSMGSRVGIGGNGTMLVSTGSALVWRSFSSSTGDASYTSISTPLSFSDLDSGFWAGTSVAVTLNTGTQALIYYGCSWAANSTAGAISVLNYRVSGATTTTGGNVADLQGESGAANDRQNLSGLKAQTLTAGSNTFTLQARVSAGTTTLSYPWILVQAR